MSARCRPRPGSTRWGAKRAQRLGPGFKELARYLKKQCGPEGEELAGRLTAFSHVGLFGQQNLSFYGSAVRKLDLDERGRARAA